MLSFLIDFINGIAESFNNYAKENQIIAGALSLWGLGVLSYFGRNIPQLIWQIIIKQTTTTMFLLSSSKAFHNFIIWINRKGYASKTRNIKISSGRWGEDDAVKSLGYGNHYFMYKHVPFKVEMLKIDNTNNLMERDELKITILGRSHKFFDLLFSEIQKDILSKEKVQIYKFNGEYWKKVNSQTKRSLDTIFLNPGIKNEIMAHIDTFIAKEDWYKGNGLSYQTGILLYGYPGCGKTSLVKAIASKYNKELYILNASMLSFIDVAIMDLPDKCILLIEDIDADQATHNRDKKSDNIKKPVVKTLMQNFSFSNFSDILNALDGIISIHGRILIATTNHIEKLDDALIRNGRFDLKIKIDYANRSVIKDFFSKYYPNFIMDSDFKVKDKIPSSMIQNLILKNLDNPEEVLKNIKQ